VNIELVREFCLSLPHVTESLQWDEDLVFKVGGKMFAVADTKEFRVSFQCAPDVFAELLERQNMAPAPYLARYHWVSLESPSAMRWTEARDLLRASYDRVFATLPKKIRDTLK
jgi:predicted DNA-binding protein (MmcQ/YjbR family)